MAAPKGHAPYNVNGEGGRPKKYTDEYIEKQADQLMVWLKDPNHVFFEDFLLDQDLHPQLMSLWASQNVRFSEAYEIAYKRQESRLKNGSITKNYDSGFAKFLLINNHGYAEKTETKISQSVTIIDDMMARITDTSKDLVSDEKQ